MSDYQYAFKDVSECEICGEDSSSFSKIGMRLNKAHGKFPHKLSGLATSVQRCKNCELIFSDPQPNPINFNDHYGVDPGAFWPPSYFEIDEEYFKVELNELGKLMDVRSGKLKALDIGAGIGKCMIAMENSSIQSWGMEPSPTFYNMALEKMNISTDRLVNQGVEDVSYESEFFDFITFGAVLEHLTNPSLAIVQALKWLKKDGIMHIEVPNSNWFVSKLGNLYYKIFSPGFASNLSPMHSPYHLYEFSHNTFEKHGEKHNYEIASYKYHVCNTYLPAFLNVLAVPYMKYSNSGMQLVIWLRKL